MSKMQASGNGSQERGWGRKIGTPSWFGFGWQDDGRASVGSGRYE